MHGLGAGRLFRDISFSAPAGSIVGIAGVQGSGHGELLRAIGGVAQADSGTVRVDGTTLTLNDPIGSVEKGMLTVPADRRGAAIVPALSLRAKHRALGPHPRGGAALGDARPRCRARGV